MPARGPRVRAHPSSGKRSVYYVRPLHLAAGCGACVFDVTREGRSHTTATRARGDSVPGRMRFWLVSAPAEGNADRAWADLSSRCAPACSRCERVGLSMGALRVGTLDRLLALSDDLGREVPRVEATLQRLFGSLRDAPAGAGAASSTPASTESTEALVTRFAWNSGLYRTDAPLRSVLDDILGRVSRIEDTLKVQKDEVAGMKQRVQAAERAETGSLLLRDVGDLLPREGLVESPHMTTLLVVVPVSGVPEWMASYERLAPMVVPRSGTKLAEDGEHALFSVTLFAKVVAEFRKACRERRYTVREYPGWREARARIEQGERGEVDAEGEGDAESEERRGSAGGREGPARAAEAAVPQKESLGDLEAAYGARIREFGDWCAQSYREVAEAYVHVCVVRLFAESVLRYGLPPDFLPAVLVPARGQTAVLRKALEGLYGGLGDVGGAGGGAGGPEDDALSALMDKVSVGSGQDEYFSYVSINVDLPDVLS